MLIAGFVASRSGCILHEGFRNPAVMASRHGGTMLYGMGMMGGLLSAMLPFAAGILAICVPVALLRLSVVGPPENSD